jgi:hypothetical protein
VTPKRRLQHVHHNMDQRCASKSGGSWHNMGSEQHGQRTTWAANNMGSEQHGQRTLWHYFVATVSQAQRKSGVGVSLVCLMALESSGLDYSHSCLPSPVHQSAAHFERPRTRTLPQTPIVAHWVVPSYFSCCCLASSAPNFITRHLA